MTLRIISLFAVVLGLCAAAPASAQFYLRTPDLRSAPVQGNEPGVGEPMPGATADEIRAELVWNMRSALNVAALQCQFEPTLMSVENYNTILYNHRDELKKAFDTLGKYFVRTAKTKKDGQNNLDRFGTRTYSSFTAVAGQRGFCTTAGSIAAQEAFAPRGGFHTIASQRMRELRDSLKPYGEQQFPGGVQLYGIPAVPRLDDACWKRDQWNGKCGPLTVATN
ncbi:MAG: hypothetical protein M3R41_02855 [Pseudomonadota bacterium]|nr:hypothetical protein [Pseudomonadota bacterium]